MAMTPAESQRLYRERLKEKKKVASNGTIEVFRKPFFEFMDPFGSTLFEQCLAQAGIEAPEFEDDRGARHFGLNDIFQDVEGDFLSDEHGSLRRAELIVDSLKDAAADLADLIRDYKRREIKARISEIETADLTDLETKRDALKTVTRLNNMLDQLEKEVRWNFPQWKVTG